MAATSPYTIMLSDRSKFERDEGIVASSETIYPGQMVAWSSGSLIQHGSAADVDAQIIFADRWPAYNKGIDDPYTQTMTCPIIYPVPGAKVYAFLETGANVAKGAALEANGAGALQALSTGRIVAFADEAVNNSGGGTGPDGSARIRVRIA